MRTIMYLLVFGTALYLGLNSLTGKILSHKVTSVTSIDYNIKKNLE